MACLETHSSLFKLDKPVVWQDVSVSFLFSLLDFLLVSIH